LALYSFTLKTDPPSAFNPNLKEPIPPKIALKPLSASPEWDQGVVYAKAQNLARTVGISCGFLDIELILGTLVFS
jgi:aminopeptidase